MLRLSSNMIGISNDETNFPHKFLLTSRQVARLPNAFKIIHQLTRHTTRRISWKFSWSISKNRITINKKCY